MATCHSIRPVLGAYLDRELTASRHTDVADHLAGCASCRAELAELEALHRAFSGLRALVPAAEVEAGVASVRRQVARHAQQVGPWERLAVWWAEVMAFHRALALGAAAALVALCGLPFAWWLLQTGSPSETLRAIEPAMVESIDYGGQSVIIMQDPASGNTIIWLQSVPPAEGDDDSM